MFVEICLVTKGAQSPFKSQRQTDKNKLIYKSLIDINLNILWCYFVLNISQI